MSSRRGGSEGWLLWFVVAVLALYAFVSFAHFSPTSVTSPTPQPSSFPVKLGPEEEARWNYTVGDLLLAAAAYPVEAYDLTGYGPFVPIFRTTPSGEPMKDALIGVLSLGANQISPAAFWTASDLAGFASASYTGVNVSYSVPVLPANPANITITGYNLTLTFQGAEATPYHYMYPPSANITETDAKLSASTLVSEGPVAEKQTGSSVVVVYEAGTVSLDVPIRLYNGSNPCLYISEGGGPYVGEGCGDGIIDVEMQVYANTYTGYYQSETMTGIVNDTINWNGTQITRRWSAGSWTLYSTLNYTFGSGPCLSSNNTCIYEYINVAGSFSSNVAQPPSWVFHHAPEAAVYSHNYAEGYLDGPAYYYGVARFLSSYIGEKGGGRYSGWEAAALIGEAALIMKINHANYSSAPDPYEAALLAGDGNQTLVAGQQVAVAQYIYPTYWVMGEALNGTAWATPWLYAFLDQAPGSAPTTVDGEPNYTLSSGGYAVMVDPTSNQSVPTGVWWGQGNQTLYSPTLEVGKTYTFRLDAFPFPNSPFFFSGSSVSEEVTGVDLGVFG